MKKLVSAMIAFLIVISVFGILPIASAETLDDSSSSEISSSQPSERFGEISAALDEMIDGFDKTDISLLYSGFEKLTDLLGPDVDVAYYYDTTKQERDEAEKIIKAGFPNYDEYYINTYFAGFVEAVDILLTTDAVIKAYQENKNMENAKAFYKNDVHINHKKSYEWYNYPEIAQCIFIYADIFIMDMKLIYKFFPNYKEIKADAREVMGPIELSDEQLKEYEENFGEKQEEIKEEEKEEIKEEIKDKNNSLKSPQTGEDNGIYICLGLLLASLSAVAFACKKIKE